MPFILIASHTDATNVFPNRQSRSLRMILNICSRGGEFCPCRQQRVREAIDEHTRPALNGTL